jgi:hypothetical protein
MERIFLEEIDVAPVICLFVTKTSVVSVHAKFRRLLQFYDLSAMFFPDT